MLRFFVEKLIFWNDNNDAYHHMLNLTKVKVAF